VPGPEFSETVLQLRAVRAGDRQALSDLLARYEPWVRQTAALRLGRPLADCTELDDIVQETLLDAFRGLEGVEQWSEGGFRHWLVRLVVNNVTDAARRSGRKKRDPARVERRLDHSSVSGGTSLPGRQPTPSQHAQAHELEARIEQGLLALAPTHREIIVLRERCGMGFDEIAAQLGFKNADTARALHHRALTRLEHLLRERES
jgi:RNA polymerase sigma-70 factor (subfamily 1)